MVRPILGIVVVPLEQVDFVLRLDVAVLGHAHVDADGRFVDVFPIQPGVGDGFPGAVDADAAGPGAAAEVLAALVAEFVEVAYPRNRGAEVAGLEGDDAAAAGQQVLAELGERVAVGRGQAHARNDNAVEIRPPGDHARKIHKIRGLAAGGLRSPNGLASTLSQCSPVRGLPCSPWQHETNKPNPFFPFWQAGRANIAAEPNSGAQGNFPTPGSPQGTQHGEIFPLISEGNSPSTAAAAAGRRIVANHNAGAASNTGYGSRRFPNRKIRGNLAHRQPTAYTPDDLHFYGRRRRRQRSFQAKR